MAQSKTMTKSNKTTKRVRSRNWCFTDFELINFQEIYTMYKDIIRYICWGVETCKKTQKKHHQGWIQLMNPKDMMPVKRLLGGKCHLEKMNGSEYQNEKYCKKDGKYTHVGKFVSQGQRSDIESIKKTLDEGGTMYEVAQDHFGDYIRYHKGFERYKELVDQKNSKEFRKVEVIIHRGPTNSGKTREAVANSEFLISGDSLNWWDGYQGEKSITIDEYSNQVNVTQMLRFLDGYQCRLAIKGGFTYARWTKVFITTNLEELHINAKQEHQDAFERRITKYVDFQ